MQKAVGNCFVLLLPLLLLSIVSEAQQENDSINKILSFPDKLLSGIERKVKSFNQRLEKQSIKYLQRLAKREDKIRRKLAKVDSSRAAQLFAQVPARYAALSQKIKHPIKLKGSGFSGEYLPYLDSINGGLSFLANSRMPDLTKLTTSADALKSLQGRLQDAEQIKAFIGLRRQQLKTVLSQYTRLPSGLKKRVDSYNKEAYYYAAQVREYKELFNDPDKLEKKALSLLNQLPAFREFMQKHSFLTTALNPPGNAAGASGNPTALIGLPSRTQVINLVQRQVGAAGPNLPASFAQHLQTAQEQVGQWRNKLSGLGGKEDIDMPNFKPNNQRTKSFFQRLEYGTNLQTQHASYYFPATTDLGLSLGYRLSDRNIIGVGASYKMGLGSGFQHMAFSSQGAGLRSFLDLKIKGSFYASGGFEYNYQQPFASLRQVAQLDDWQQSGLVGISKIASMKTKFFKKTKFQLLWDFLSYQQHPRAQALKFRVGYAL